MSRVKCTFCDARAWTEEALVRRHAPGCPFHHDARSCKDCGRVGKHAERCPQVIGNPR
jgi:hypothetical protein